MTDMEEHPPGSGRRRPSVPLPFYGVWHVACRECGRRFWPHTGVSKDKPAYRRYEARHRAGHGAGTEVVS